MLHMGTEIILLMLKGIGVVVTSVAIRAIWGYVVVHKHDQLFYARIDHYKGMLKSLIERAKCSVNAGDK